MKKSNLFLMILAASLMVLVFSCNQNEIADTPTGVEFLLTPDVVTHDQGRLNQEQPVVGEGICDLSLAAYAIIQIDGSSYTVDIKQWGDDFKTNLIELMPGTYNVTSFVVYDGDGNALYATPMQASDFGKFVTIPLPIEFTVEIYQKLEYNIEVLCIEEFSPPEFGFVFWNIDLKETRNLCIFANYCEPDFGHKVANLQAFVYPDAANTDEEDLIWTASADGDFESEQEGNELLCLKFPYDPDEPAAEQMYYVVLLINSVEYAATLNIEMIDAINAGPGYLHLNRNCINDFGPFEPVDDDDDGDGAVGELIKNVELPVSGNGVSVAVDCEGNIYYTNAGQANVYVMDADGNLLNTLATVDGDANNIFLDELAWDATNNLMWAVEHGSNPIDVYTVNLSTGEVTFQWQSATTSIGTFRDGIAYDGSDNTLWITGDVSNTIEHYEIDGTLINQITPKNAEGGTLGLISGVLVGTGDVLFVGRNGAVEIVKVNKISGEFIAKSTSPGGARDEGLACDPVNFSPKLAVWSRDFDGAFISVIEAETGSCECGGGDVDVE